MDAKLSERLWFSNLKLTGFRNYKTLEIDLTSRHVVLIGNNGAGKTNILEAISFLSPGRGIRRAAYDDIALDGGDGTWTISAKFEGTSGQTQIGSGYVQKPNEIEKHRRIKINGETIRGTDQLAEIVRIIWISPSMDRLFAATATERRRFLDRMVLAIDPQHGKRVSSFEKVVRSRNRLLSEHPGNSSWIESLEVQIAELGVAISIARRELITYLAKFVDSPNSCHSKFPTSRLSLVGEFEESVRDMPATDAEEFYQKTLRIYRPRDIAAGRTLSGPHLTDLNVVHKEKEMPAAQSSTGEQKALLIGIVLAHARLVLSLSGSPPILLLDEITAHLDSTRRKSLFDQLEELGSQCWLTGTEIALFDSLDSRAQIFQVVDGMVESVPLDT